MPINRRMNKDVYTYAMKSYLAIKKDEIMLLAAI